MASQGQPTNAYHNPGQALTQDQMRRNECVNLQSDIHSQGQATNFFQETGTQAKNMAQGAVNMAREAAVGAANMVHGAADAVKNTLGMDNSGTTDTLPTTASTAMNHPSGTTTNMGGSTHPSNVSTRK